MVKQLGAFTREEVCLPLFYMCWCHDIGVEGYVTERLENREVIIAFEIRISIFKPWLYHLLAV